ncbi:hypothetical protein QUN99_003406 [Vibrio parahaemolyticus]|nr:hypothetical protein [Vibrio parahaemolyticus]
MTAFEQRVEELTNSAKIACDLLGNVHNLPVNMRVTQQVHTKHAVKITFSCIVPVTNKIVELLMAEIEAEEEEHIGVVCSEGNPNTDTLTFIAQKELTPHSLAKTVHHYLYG